MMVDLNEKELFALMVVVSTDRREKGDKSTYDEALELKLVEGLLKETGHIKQTPINRECATGRAAWLDEKRLREEQK